MSDYIFLTQREDFWFFNCADDTEAALAFARRMLDEDDFKAFANTLIFDETFDTIMEYINAVLKPENKAYRLVKGEKLSSDYIVEPCDLSPKNVVRVACFKVFMKGTGNRRILTELSQREALELAESVGVKDE